MLHEPGDGQPINGGQLAAPVAPAAPAGALRSRFWPPRRELLLLVAAAALWWWSAYRTHGLFWPDEIFQSLEPAHRLAFGYGFVAWEFQAGARSWVFPGLLAGVLKLGAGLGLTSALGLLWWAKGFMVLVGLGAVLACMRLGRALGGRAAGLIAGALMAVLPPHLIFAGRCMSEMACAALLAFAAWLLLDEGAGRPQRAGILAGILAGLATVLRPPTGLVAVGLLVLLLLGGQRADRRRAQVNRYLQGLALALGLGGALDWLTWGAPFHAFWLNLRYNLLEGRAADYGREPFSFYLDALWTSTAPGFVLLAIGLGLAGRAARPVLAVVGGYLLVLSLLPHKELRFLLPVMPLMLAACGAGLQRAVSRLGAQAGRRAVRASAVIGVGLGCLMIWRSQRLTYQEMGETRFGPASALPVGQISEDFNRLLLRLHHLPDLCGLAVADVGVIWLGGYSYLHRNVPFLALTPAMARSDLAGLPAANYLLASTSWGPPAGASEVARSGLVVLYRWARPCAPVARGFDLFTLPPMAGAPAQPTVGPPP